MIRSMTGFGEAQLEQAGQLFHLEVRSVNQRYFKAAVYLPEDFAFLEPEVERLLHERLTRGSVTVRLHVRGTGAQAPLPLNVVVLRAYLDQLRAAAGDDPRVTIDLATLLTLPGVSQLPDLDESERRRRWSLLSALINSALDRLLVMRVAEGQVLAADLAAQCEVIGRSLAVIRERAPTVVAEYRDRLKARVQELIADSNVRLAEEDLLKEVSVYAERSDLNEEVSRLAGHLEQFRALMQSPVPAGRKLEFIAQEMLREANTMGSKAGDVAIAREIIEIKSAIDRIKEQVANVE